jgi:O-antigen/teichoic acid export membrane protein
LISKLKALFRDETAKLMGRALFMFVCRITAAVSVIVMQVALARWMGAEQLGIYIYAFAWCVLLAAIAGLGLPEAAFRFVGKGMSSGEFNRILSYAFFNSRIILISGTVIAAIACALVLGFDNLVAPEARNTFLIALVSVPVFALMMWFSTLAQSFYRYRLAILPMLIFRPLILLFAVLLIWTVGLTLSAFSVTMVHLFIMLPILFGQFWYLRAALKDEFPAAEVADNESRTWLRTAIPLLIAAFFVKYFLELNVILAGIYLPADQIAIFNATFRTAFLIGFGILAMDAITAPRVAELHGGKDLPELQKLISQATRIKCLGAVVGVVLLTLFGKLVLGLFGPEFVVGYSALLILAGSQVIVAAFGAGTQLLAVSGNQDKCLVVFGCSAAALFVLQALLVPRFGLNGVALAVLLVVAIQSFWVNRIVVARLGIYPSILNIRRQVERPAAS